MATPAEDANNRSRGVINKYLAPYGIVDISEYTLCHLVADYGLVQAGFYIGFAECVTRKELITVELEKAASV